VSGPARPESCLRCGSTNLAPAERLPASCWRCLDCRAVFQCNDDGPRPRLTPEEESLVQRLTGLTLQVNARTVEEIHHPFIATLLCVVMEQVHAGGKLTLVGSGPLSDPSRRGYDATLTSHTGARHAAAHGDSLGQCLEQLVIRWGKQ
jgi:hypothetical protein